ncbi:Selenocysteine insertion sequence-binding protein 2 [Channa argus]|uniref:Selenocysteine insertion sequence-binding protein 2 n=1 Tax=Channa argus TaxID=215402 RepID=A0A6G1PZ15_CHAAH|nr:Selenocysteine insertion sequence-binding protein 2 [Channa argus]
MQDQPDTWKCEYTLEKLNMDKASKVNNDFPAQGTIVDKNSLDAQRGGRRGGYRGTRYGPGSAEKSKSVETDSVPFEVKMTDFPELTGVSLGKAQPPLVQKECWGPTLTSPQKQASTRKFVSRGSSSRPDFLETANIAKPDSCTVSLGQPVVTSWANVASQPPKKPVPVDKAISSNHIQTGEMTAQQQVGAPGKKKRRKKKKKSKDADEDPEDESEGPKLYQEPPKFEDEEEFPGLGLAVTGADRLTSSRNAAKLYKEKAEKVSGKKSKVPVQLDIGNMLAVLEKKQQSQKPNQDTKPVILSVGGGLPVVQKQPSVQRKPPWQQDKIAHNPLDSTSPLVKKGKQREVPKAKKPTPLKKAGPSMHRLFIFCENVFQHWSLVSLFLSAPQVILKEREERKQRHLMEEMGLLPENELKPENDAAEEKQCEANASDEFGSPTEELDDQLEFNGTSQMIEEGDEETNKDQEIVEQQTTSPVPCAVYQPKIHSRKFRDYCSQMLSRDVDECVTTLLKELVRFQDRLYQKDPMKARMKRRIVMGLREVLKHLKLRKVKCVIISPNCERIQSKGGLDEAIHTIIDTCREQRVPFVFALSRKALGRCVNKAVPVSLVGIFNYDGAQDCYHKMIELSSEARRAYEVMVTSLEQTEQAEPEQAEDNEEELQISSLGKKADAIPDTTQVEEPEYIKVWKRMLEKENNHTFLNFEEQLSSMHLDNEYTENSEDEKS